MHARGCDRSFRRIRRMLLTTRNLRGPEIGVHSLAGEPVGPLAGLVARGPPDRPRSLTHSHATSRLDEGFVSASLLSEVRQPLRVQPAI